MSVLFYEHAPEMLKIYLCMNDVKGAFVHKEGPREYLVYEGDPATLRGFRVAEFFRYCDAKALADKITALINRAENRQGV